MLIIDAYNVLHQWRGGPTEVTRGRDLAALAGLVSRTSFGTSRVRFVCDGAAPNASMSHIGAQFVYAGSGHSADEVIIHDVGTSTAPRRITVVTSDRRIAASVRRHGAEVIASGSFLARVIREAALGRFAADRRPAISEVPLGSAEIGVWLREFGYSNVDPSGPIEPSPGTVHVSGSVPLTGPAAQSILDQSHAGIKSVKPGTAGGSVQSRPLSAAETDAVLAEALRHWPDLTVDDLDMRRWIGS